MKKKVIIIDNYDSFTHILKEYCGRLGADVEVFLNDRIGIAELRKLNPTHLILSPGPGNVDESKDVGIMFEVIREFHQSVPLLGVCLGHQALGRFFGGKIVRAPRVMHGKRSVIWHNRAGILKGVHNPLTAMRYHSLVIDTPFYMNPDVDVTAHTEAFEIMAIQHKKFPVFGVQFHPESLGTPAGEKIIKNFLNS